MLLSFSGALNVSDVKPAEGSCEMAVSSAGEGGLESWRSFSLPESGSDDQSVLGLKEFFRTMFVAYVLDREITVDLSIWLRCAFLIAQMTCDNNTNAALCQITDI